MGDAPATTLQNYRHADSGVHWLVQAPQFHYYARFSRYESFNLQPLKQSMTNISSSIFFVLVMGLNGIF